MQSNGLQALLYQLQKLFVQKINERQLAGTRMIKHKAGEKRKNENKTKDQTKKKRKLGQGST